MNIDDSALAESLRRLAQPDDTGSITGALELVVQACVDLFAVDGAGVLIADEQDMLAYAASSDGPGRLLEQTEAEAGEGPCTEAFVSSRVVTTRDLTAEAERWPTLAAVMADQPVRAVLGTPVLLGGVPVGTLDVYKERPHDWDESEVSALGRYAEVVATILGAGAPGAHRRRARQAAPVRPRLPHRDRARRGLPHGEGVARRRRGLQRAAQRRPQPAYQDRSRLRARPRHRHPAGLTSSTLSSGATPPLGWIGLEDTHRCRAPRVPPTVTTSRDLIGTATPAAPAPAVPSPRAGELVIASVPANHVYVRHLAPEDGSGPRRLPDPRPARAATTQQWWPPVMLDPAWVDTHDFDVYHLHFGFDARSVGDLEALVASLRRRGKPFVFTVHDLRNPHHRDRTEHDRQLDVLVPAADALITLTRGAADEIRSRWGREAVVIPHPHVVPLETMHRAAVMREVRRRGPRADGFRVGMHVKSLRAGMHPHPLVPTIVEALRDLPGAVLQVNGHRDVLLPDGARYDAELAEALHAHAARGEVDLRIHDFLDDDSLWCYLASLDVSVLPYRFGTHSGWLEACRDLGTAVIAPSCGYFADQAPVLTYGHDEEHLDAASLVAALREAYAGHVAAPPSVGDRRAQRDFVAAAHARLYATLAGGGR